MTRSSCQSSGSSARSRASRCSSRACPPASRRAPGCGRLRYCRTDRRSQEMRQHRPAGPWTPPSNGLLCRSRHWWPTEAACWPAGRQGRHLRHQIRRGRAGARPGLHARHGAHLQRRHSPGGEDQVGTCPGWAAGWPGIAKPLTRQAPAAARPVPVCSLGCLPALLLEHVAPGPAGRAKKQQTMLLGAGSILQRLRARPGCMCRWGTARSWPRRPSSGSLMGLMGRPACPPCWQQPACRRASG